MARPLGLCVPLLSFPSQEQASLPLGTFGSYAPVCPACMTRLALYALWTLDWQCVHAGHRMKDMFCRWEIILRGVGDIGSVELLCMFVLSRDDGGKENNALRRRIGGWGHAGSWWSRDGDCAHHREERYVHFGGGYVHFLLHCAIISSTCNDGPPAPAWFLSYFSKPYYPI